MKFKYSISTIQDLNFEIECLEIYCKIVQNLLDEKLKDSTLEQDEKLQEEETNVDKMFLIVYRIEQKRIIES